jgi:hypothetical protein
MELIGYHRNHRRRQSARRWRAGKVLALAGVTAAAMSAAPHEHAQAMSAYLWQKRPLVIFAPSRQHAGAVRQTRIINANRTGFSERDMVVVTVVGDRVTTRFGSGPKLGADALRARFGIGCDEFRALLVGKDGTVKLSRGEAVDAGRLFSLIDSMPMRRQEMRNWAR